MRHHSLTINTGHLQCFITFSGLLPVKNFANGLFVDEPITIMWLSPAIVLIISMNLPCSKRISFSIPERRKNLSAQAEAFLQFSLKSVVLDTVTAVVQRSKAWATRTPYFTAFGPPALRAKLPPKVQVPLLAGSGG